MRMSFSDDSEGGPVPATRYVPLFLFIDGVSVTLITARCLV